MGRIIAYDAVKFAILQIIYYYAFAVYCPSIVTWLVINSLTLSTQAF